MTTTTSSMEKLGSVLVHRSLFDLLDFLSVCFLCCGFYFDLGFLLCFLFLLLLFFYLFIYLFFIFDLCLVFTIQEAEFQLLSYSPCGSVYWTSQFRCPVSISPKKLLFKTFLSNTVDLSCGDPRLEYVSSNQLCFFHKFLFI